eukprot:CAMPEP_0119272750 /NCGR_PEP_ID=MMETSP1329-20130426/9023_1 /TAXON_ID=114041 /ORGANISM="Genus nov. species nov., Strain RCC1024" /LENGTH=206 /DNA_ID=CAMNT_0007272849 /DNA_START=111 /DNA_END=731 /DNA_ORIENTATION=-
MASRVVLALCLSAARALVHAPAKAPAATALRSTEVGIGPESGGVMFDPAGFSEIASPTTMKWFRAAELKHGRVAMLACLGWVTQCTGGLGGKYLVDYPLEAGKGPLSVHPLEANMQFISVGQSSAYAQFILLCGAIELVTESTIKPHYMSPGGNGYLDLFGYSKSGEDLTRLQDQELKNGRLAMIGIASFVSAVLVPGSVPGCPWV